MTNEKLNSAIAEGTINKVYSGKDNCCRCGCQGKYYSRGDKMFSSILKKAIKLAFNQGFEDYGNCINIPYGNNKAYTIYFD